MTRQNLRQLEEEEAQLARESMPGAITA